MKKMVLLSLFILLSLISLPIMALGGITNLSALSHKGVTLFLKTRVQNDWYAWGNCTYWAAYRRIQIGEPIPNTWGNAITWAVRAAKDGYLVNHVPSVGAIMQQTNALGGLGHVAFVEQVNPINGSWTISEMNRVGFDEVDYRTMSESMALKYNFIHNKI